MLKTFSITNIGKIRRTNQDFVYTSEQKVGNLPNLFLVADGMGGHNAGDYASRMTVETMVEKISASLETDPRRILEEAITAANIRVRQEARRLPELDGMGTTIVAAVCDGTGLLVANVGDSRLYVENSREIVQITRDHSWVEEMVRNGELARTDARISERRNIITRAVGAEDTVQADYFEVGLEEGDVVLMCTDGLTNMLEDEEIRMMMESSRDIVEKAQKLVWAANERGGSDNISVVLIEPVIR